MSFRVVLTAEAEHNRDEAFAYYAQRSPDGAASWYGSYLATLGVLAETPNRYPTASEAIELGIDLRQADFGTRPNRPTHRLLFLIKGSEVQILALRHHAQTRWKQDR